MPYCQLLCFATPPPGAFCARFCGSFFHGAILFITVLCPETEHHHGFYTKLLWGFGSFLSLARFLPGYWSRNSGMSCCLCWFQAWKPMLQRNMQPSRPRIQMCCLKHPTFFQNWLSQVDEIAKPLASTKEEIFNAIWPFLSFFSFVSLIGKLWFHSF